uniref:G-protein coupled receptors family 2 profile 2 domain-containing protein n=1 Tax=Biomphalaria glabrata TaxID=6526 RepID=A0A2C9LN45_BIOGL
MPEIKLMYTIGYLISLTTLILALSIMVYCKRLHCARNIIHMNMFLAFGLRAVFSLLKNILLVNDLGFVNDVNQTGSDFTFVESGTHWECKLFFTLFYYIIFASVMWLFNEGLYLQLILSVAVFSDKTRMEWFLLLGWGTPFCFLLPWVLCRIHLDDMLCWNVHVYKSLYWILHGPMVASVAINFVIFINIIRMLFTKLRAVNCSESKMFRYRKLAKSTLILIPLFAVYYMIFIWLPDDINPTAELFKMYVEMLFNSFQGFLVALLFCFLNHEVQFEIRKTWTRHLNRHIGGGRRNTLTNHSFWGSSSRDYQSHGNTKPKKKLFRRKSQQPLSDIAEEPVLSLSTTKCKARGSLPDIDLEPLHLENVIVTEEFDKIAQRERQDVNVSTRKSAYSADLSAGVNGLDLLNHSVVISNVNADMSRDLADIKEDEENANGVLQHSQIGDNQNEASDSPTRQSNCAILYLNDKTWSSELQQLVPDSTSANVNNKLKRTNGLITYSGQCVL